MRRLLHFLFLLQMSLGYAEPLQLDIQGEAGILLNAETGSILFEKEAYALHYPASTTKVATALYVLKKKKNAIEDMVVAKQDALVSVAPDVKRKSNYTLPAYWNESDGTHIGLKVGEEMSLHDLLKGMMICSGNDAANVIAQSVSGTIPQFMNELNEFLKEMGCECTYFCNPHGLHHPEHQTTAYDLALMAKEALKDPVFCEIVSQARFIRPKTNKQKATTLLQGNRLLRAGKFYYSKAIGIKTGYHSKAKHNLIGAARQGERVLIAVLLGYQQRDHLFQDAIRLFEMAFNQPKVQRTFLASGPQKFTQLLPHSNRALTTYLPENMSLEYFPAEEPEVKCLLYWDPLYLPIEKDQKVGEVHLVTSSEVVLKRLPLLAAEAVQYKWPYQWISWMESLTYSYWSWMGMILLFLIFLIDSKKS